MNTENILSNLNNFRTLLSNSGVDLPHGKNLYLNGSCTKLSQNGLIYSFLIEDRHDDYEVSFDLSNEKLSTTCNCPSTFKHCSHIAAAFMTLEAEVINEHYRSQKYSDTIVYTRQEMIDRVIAERQSRAQSENYKIKYADNIFGEHTLTTENKRQYKLTLRNLDNKSGYCNCPDFKTNKLGTCKHLMYIFHHINKKFGDDNLLKAKNYPFVEIYCDPLNNYQISYYLNKSTKINDGIRSLIQDYFNDSKYISPAQYNTFLSFLEEARKFKKIIVRPEVEETINKHFDEQSLTKFKETVPITFDLVRAKLYQYQKEGISFSVFKSGAIIADEMGLGKTIQAIATAILKKKIFDFKKTLVICPASLKAQWKKEIEKFTNEPAIIIEGSRLERLRSYEPNPKNHAFYITNYEAVLRDITAIKKFNPDLVILDEAQRIKNYETKTSYAVKSIPKKHALIITGTPIENRLGDLYSIVNFIDPKLLSPLWEFSMNHCYFDIEKRNRVKGYFKLDELKSKLKGIIVRRMKKEVMDELPDIVEIKTPIDLSLEQQQIHAGFGSSLAKIIHKKVLTLFDMQRIRQILTCMRMVCNSTYLIDKETNISPKLEELENILIEKLDLKNTKKKILIFTEWKEMQKLIAKKLEMHEIGYVILNSDVKVEDRGKLIDHFEKNDGIKIFLSTDAGGTGLNLQMADTVINFELPWNPAKLNQRTGRIDRIGQKATKLTIINLISTNSIESRIENTLSLKQSLFDAVLDDNATHSEVNLDAKGQATFLSQMKELVGGFTSEEVSDQTQELTKTEGVQKTLEEKILQESQKVTVTDEMILERELNEEPNKEFAEVIEPPQIPELETQISSTSKTAELMENTLNQAMGFLNNMMKLVSGKELLKEGNTISVDKNTGEVTLKFKIPT